METIPTPSTRPVWLYVGWTGWLLVTALSIFLFITGVTAMIRQPLPRCATANENCYHATVSQEDVDLAESFGVPNYLFIGGFWTANLIAKSSLFITGLLICWQRRTDWVALLLSIGLMPVLLEGVSPALTGLPLVLTVVFAIGTVCFLPLPFIFPNGRYEPGWTRWVAWPLAILVGIMQVLGPTLEELFGIMNLLWSVLAMAAIVHRYRRAASPTERQQLKWVTLGMISVVIVGVVYSGGGLLYPITQPSPSRLLFLMINGFAYLAGYSAFAICLGIAVLRYRLWTVDLVINRTLVYGTLTTIVIAAYILVVGGFGALFQSSGNLFISLLATGLIALAFNPLRLRLQQLVNRLMYGKRDDPYAALSHFSQQLESTLTPESILPTTVNTIAQTLKLPYVAIAIRETDTDKIAAAYGTPAPNLSTLPLTYRGQFIGELHVAQRSPQEPFTPTEQRLLEDIAHQAGVAVHAAQLTTDLQHARTRLVNTREEERRRLRRDLHDGLGPKLAGQALILEAIRDSLESQPESRALVDHLIQDSQSVVTEVRELVQGLRPPALDEFGLVGAIRNQAKACEHTGLRVIVNAPDLLPRLPAAVEVAAFRIVQESLTNVVKHAQATTCTITIAVDQNLQLEITDDGVGLAATRRSGVGLGSMRERAEEIGGTCAIESGATGVRVTAVLPIAKS